MNSNVKTGTRSTLGCVVAMALACTLVVSNAHADDRGRSETVKFTDLNLDTAAGVEALYSRIHTAAWRLCRQPAGEEAATSNCIRNSESEAIGKVNAPLLTVLYQKKTGNYPQTITANR